MKIAREFLATLFRLAENASSRGQPPEVRLGLTPAKCPHYFQMRDLEEAREFRAELALAERKGAISIETDARAERPRDVRAISVASIAALAAHLNLPVRGAQADTAWSVLSPYVAEFPVLVEIVERWRLGRKVRGDDPTDATITALVDAMKVMQARRGSTDEAMLRRFSIALFNDSKRIEALPKWLDALSAQNLSATGLTAREIFSALGLHKAPLPFLIAGDVQAIGSQGCAPLLRPYMGIPAGSVSRFSFPAPPACVLTIENLQTFHEFAAASERHAGVVVVFTGGMPSPAWRQMFEVLLAELPAAASLYHFGDLDIGGLRISRAIAQITSQSGRALRPWLMDPRELVERGYALNPITLSQAAEMSRLCHAIAWHDIAESVLAFPGTMEQEALHPDFPAPPPTTATFASTAHDS